MIAKVSANHRFQCEDAGDLHNYFINSCEEKCICEEIAGAGYDHVCYREREEFTCMSTDRRERFLNAYKAVTTEGHPQFYQMKQLLESHGDPSANFYDIHEDPYFLPWHRWFAMAVENILRNEDCRITLPWWRWSKKSLSWWVGSPFLSFDTWLGTNSFASCVSDGAFQPPWKPPTGDPLTCHRRNFVLIPMPTGTNINTVLNLPAAGFGTNYYNEFSFELETLIHNTAHTNIRGDMMTFLSPREPAFFLHHGYIDQLWDRWQRKSPTHLNVYCSGCNKDDSLPHIVGSTPHTIRDNFDLKLMGVKYVNKKSRVIGPGHVMPMPLCLMMRSKLKYFKKKGIWNSDEIEMALAARNDVPQLMPETPNYETLRKRFNFWYTGRANETKLNEKIEKMVAIKLKSAKNVVNPITEKELKELNNPASYMLGYNLDSMEVKEALNKTKICPFGYVWTDKGCKREKELFKQLKKVLKKGTWSGGEIIANKDLSNSSQTV
eukprot:CAMPEP_0198255250 /NCGR_PEP_ID=MMETSP1447-20131203/5402_1 /TAXON_ID=420782 /ORGANISM="Chaetoceros dichaeta, Strain CCMP1751" /LENGTH=491 /DNA_ID=CAMNT_0043941573 /DNA_START=54 /DNA_END=1529 /DNA_ORIENTATION=+